MAKKTFPYEQKEIKPNATDPSRTVYRPVMIATITASNGNSYDLRVLPDSGADSCGFPLALAKILGLDVSTMGREQVSGVGAQNTTYCDTLTIDLGEGLSFTTYASFTPGLNQLGLGLLGQSGFFENFNVEFRHREKIFTVERS